jgi:hypothetical protein
MEGGTITTLIFIHLLIVFFQKQDINLDIIFCCIKIQQKNNNENK